MTPRSHQFALLLFALISTASGQDVTITGAERRAVQGQEARDAKEPRDPFKSRPDATWDQGFQKAGRRSVEALSAGRRRLMFVLSQSNDPGTASSFADVELTFRDRWLIEELKRRIPGLSTPRLVDRSTRYDGSSTIDWSREIEVEGDRALVERAESFLDDVVRQNRRLIQASAWIIREPASRLEATDVQVRALHDEELNQRVAALRQGRADVLVVPPTTIFGGQTASASIVNQSPYIRDFEVEMVGQSIIADPIIDVVQDGVVIGMSPIVRPDGERLDFGLSIAFANLKRPFRSITTTLAGFTTPVTWQVPEVSLVEWSSSDLTLEDGDRGFLVTGLSVTEWNESGESRVEDVSLLIRIESVAPAETLSEAEAVVGSVLGVDPVGLVIVRRRAGAEAPAIGATLQFRRDGRGVGSGTLTETFAEVLLLNLTGGEAAKGDDAVAGP